MRNTDESLRVFLRGAHARDNATKHVESWL